ncbi:MFS transporter [Compostibacillus humi]|uniref:MFS transporter n=1 Tax=Compostibacillus humi TaxID=1245525 RepID=A0A8J2TPW0_9BACI|nr:MFS transporter [Compostibacillus humi]GFZ87782.1 MFS transporter [Compostibacillus humi]
MDKRVYLLTIVSFVVGMVELIIGGILDLVAADLQISLGQAGLLITIFSLTFAFSAPVLSVITRKIERKQLTLITLVIFFLSNILKVVSPSYFVLFLARILSAASSSLLIVLCVVMAANIVQPKYRGRAIGIVNMGVSASLVLGVPIGLTFGNMFGWRAPFLFIAILSLFSIAGVYFFMEKVAPTKQISLWKQIGSLKEKRVFFAHVTTFLFMSGHSALYAYLTPFVKTTMNASPTWVSVVYFIFGAAAVTGGAVGGASSDRFGQRPTTYSVILLFTFAIFTIPYATFHPVLFTIVLIVWGMMSWALTPPLQSYLMDVAKETASIQVSFNNSALHLGIAFGSTIGGIVIEQTSVTYNATVGGFITLLAIGTAFMTMRNRIGGKQRNKI